MKKLLMFTLLLFSLSGVLWLAASWLIGVKTEQAVQQTFSSVAIPNTSNAQLFPTHTLVDYQRTLFGATAITRMDVRHTPLSAWVDELQFQHQIQHGPLLWDGQFDIADLMAWKHEKLLPVLSRWQTRLDTTPLEEDVREWLATAFSAKPPLTALSVVDYEQTIDYQASLAALDSVTETGEQLQLAGVEVSGRFNAQTSQPTQLTITTGLLEFINDQGRGYIPALNVLARIDHARGGYQFEFSAPDAGVEVGGEFMPMPVTFALQGEADIRNEGDNLDGSLLFNLRDFAGLQYPLAKLVFKADVTGLNSDGLLAANTLFNRSQDLQARLDWNEEEIETPEARREQVQLELTINEVSSQLLQTILAKALQQGETQLQYELDVATGQGDLSQQTSLVYKGTAHTGELGAVESYGLDDWLGLLRGTIELDMAQSMVPTEWQSWLEYPIERGSVQEHGDRYRMDFRLTGYDAELNSRVVAFDRLAAKFIPPQAGRYNSTALAITPEVLDLIESEGLNDGVLQQLARRHNLSADALEMLQQLQAMNEQLQ